MGNTNQENFDQKNQQSDLYNFLRALAVGFGIVSIGIVIAIVGYIVVTK